MSSTCKGRTKGSIVMSRILVGADICSTENNVGSFVCGDIENVLGRQLIEQLRNSDIKVFNLEGPLYNKNTPICKCGPNLKMPEEAVELLKKLDIDVVTLANNHIMDHGNKALTRTIQILDEAQIAYLGIGESIDNMKDSHIDECNGKKIGIYGCAEHEFTIATENMPGANPYDPLVTFDEIQKLKKTCDYLIVLYHGGKEYYRYPSPELQRVFRKMADVGADLVVAQHTHCIGCYEEYKGVTLVYGQGNFIFDGGNDEFWRSGLLIDVTISNEDKKVQFIPFVKDEAGKYELASGREKEILMKEFNERSEKVIDDKFVRLEYNAFCRDNLSRYLSVMHGNNLVFKFTNKLLGNRLRRHMKWFYSYPNSTNALLNYVECEAHRELLITALKDYKG